MDDVMSHIAQHKVDQKVIQTAIDALAKGVQSDLIGVETYGKLLVEPFRKLTIGEVTYVTLYEHEIRSGNNCTVLIAAAAQYLGYQVVTLRPNAAPKAVVDNTVFDQNMVKTLCFILQHKGAADINKLTDRQKPLLFWFQRKAWKSKLQGQPELIKSLKGSSHKTLPNYLYRIPIKVSGQVSIATSLMHTLVGECRNKYVTDKVPEYAFIPLQQIKSTLIAESANVSNKGVFLSYELNYIREKVKTVTTDQIDEAFKSYTDLFTNYSRIADIRIQAKRLNTSIDAVVTRRAAILFPKSKPTKGKKKKIKGEKSLIEKVNEMTKATFFDLFKPDFTDGLKAFIFEFKLAADHATQIAQLDGLERELFTGYLAQYVRVE
jgi:hypothetical protein